jgi:hypothetical protein
VEGVAEQRTPMGRGRTGQFSRVILILPRAASSNIVVCIKRGMVWRAKPEKGSVVLAASWILVEFLSSFFLLAPCFSTFHFSGWDKT